MKEIPDITESEFMYDPNDNFGKNMNLPRLANVDGYFIYEKWFILIITNSKYLESFRFYTHEFTEVTLRKIFQEIAQEENICGERLYYLYGMAHELSPFGKNKKTITFK